MDRRLSSRSIDISRKGTAGKVQPECMNMDRIQGKADMSKEREEVKGRDRSI